MQIISSLSAWQSIRAELSNDIGFVPTMGCLHAGHQALIEKAVNSHALSVVSLYVNPTQFDRQEDLVNYPKTEEADCALLENLGVDYVLMPNSEEMYPEGNQVICHTDHPMARCLEGVSRPGHFDGMLTVVLKWLNLVRPSVIYMGDKDYQQHVLVKTMIQAYHLPVQMQVLATQREASGLPFSSRLRRLTAEGMEKARAFARRFHALTQADLSDFVQWLKDQDMPLDYLEQKDQQLFVAVFVESVRLIDHRRWEG